MSTDVETRRMVRLFGKEIPRSSVETALFTSVGFFVVFNALAIPFALPKIGKFLGAPYLPSSRASFRAVLENLPGNLNPASTRLVDIGSGDGRLVEEAARFGMKSVGIELNPWLVFASKFRLWKQRKNGEIWWKNAWEAKNDLITLSPDIIVFYGRPGQGVMTKFGNLAEEISDETGKSIFVVSNKFPIPNWQLRQIALVDEFIVYKLHSNKEEN
jgi:hypothetical protein